MTCEPQLCAGSCRYTISERRAKSRNSAWGSRPGRAGRARVPSPPGPFCSQGLGLPALSQHRALSRADVCYCSLQCFPPACSEHSDTVLEASTQGMQRAASPRQRRKNCKSKEDHVDVARITQQRKGASWWHLSLGDTEDGIWSGHAPVICLWDARGNLLTGPTPFPAPSSCWPCPQAALCTPTHSMPGPGWLPGRAI